MLYREHRPIAIFGIVRLGLTIAAWSQSARRRRAELDLMAMSPHLKRDLGLLDRDLSGLMQKTGTAPRGHRKGRHRATLAPSPLSD
jgi:uncharacterized protein YjiS (DUF1127 family)